MIFFGIWTLGISYEIVARHQRELECIRLVDVAMNGVFAAFFAIAIGHAIPKAQPYVWG